MKLVFFLEEPSARVMLEGILPVIAAGHEWQFVEFDGKQDLEKRLARKLRGWLYTENTRFIVLRDQDSGNCGVIKDRLRQICANAGRQDALIRIACRELESFYLGDLAAVGEAFGKNLAKHQQNRKFCQPDKLNNAKQELKKLVPEYQEISGSRQIAPLLLRQNNASHSFNVLVNGIRNLISSF
ncbi:Uncharacterised protein [Kingella potus]|uniref:DUF4276 family protein n=1 Tax=Kingella potus TaxID=265175 RepID=A0A377R2A9_9NEIS|nr:DUF4276 family protein [Kingella potus]UOP00476.1 DUF4276 family protein [Kingella potus]STR02453.1 Uncharacterised protein [Kingella potus]